MSSEKIAKMEPQPVQPGIGPLASPPPSSGLQSSQLPQQQSTSPSSQQRQQQHLAQQQSPIQHAQQQQHLAQQHSPIQHAQQQQQQQAQQQQQQMQQLSQAQVVQHKPQALPSMSPQQLQQQHQQQQQQRQQQQQQQALQQQLQQQHQQQQQQQQHQQQHQQQQQHLHHHSQHQASHVSPPMSIHHLPAQQSLPIHTGSQHHPHHHQCTSPTPKSVAMPTPTKQISNEEIPPMHAIRVSTKGFRQRWNGQQWRRLCDEPTCVREAQRLSLCAKHQPIKDWRPSRRSGSTSSPSTKKSSPKRGQRRSHPVDFQTALTMPGVTPHAMPLNDPSLFPVDANNLQMSVGEHEDQLAAPMHAPWGNPMGGMPGYAPMPSAYPQQGYPYENPALLHLAAEQMAAAWSMQQPPPSHMPSQYIR
ncbi:mediator of RNA polymerase II transcription subunit 15-like [Sycon ciliatum]|uniref:mediator of RNA polymerase II transcription subunit 15-like n=1 Tax=Sycon ciliatum TaxID=27933 RepID=UPI0031F64619